MLPCIVAMDMYGNEGSGKDLGGARGDVDGGGVGSDRTVANDPMAFMEDGSLFGDLRDDEWSSRTSSCFGCGGCGRSCCCDAVLLPIFVSRRCCCCPSVSAKPGTDDSGGGKEVMVNCVDWKGETTSAGAVFLFRPLSFVLYRLLLWLLVLFVCVCV